MLGVKPSTRDSDKLIVKNSVSGGDNLLDVSLLVGSEEQVALTQDLVMVDAPAGTSHSYFSFADSYSGFSVYTPNYQVKEDNDRVLWVPESNKSAEPTPAPEVTPEPELTPVPEVTPEPVTPAENRRMIVPLLIRLLLRKQKPKPMKKRKRRPQKLKMKPKNRRLTRMTGSLFTTTCHCSSVHEPRVSTFSVKRSASCITGLTLCASRQKAMAPGQPLSREKGVLWV